MDMIIATVSILLITIVIWFLNKVLPFKVCPICAGVSATWLMLTALSLVGYMDSEVSLPIILLLMGGSVVGIAYQSESLLWARKHPLLTKVIIIAIGMPLAFWAAQKPSVPLFVAEVLLLAVLTYVFFVRRTEINLREKENESGSLAALEKRLKDCC